MPIYGEWSAAFCQLSCNFMQKCALLFVGESSLMKQLRRVVLKLVHR